ncbi:hypothetical protein [Arthrobacter sp. GMC3]|uniref:hypothetical protein n=1 Tax=Arthrobacter sp. GMC3 TaxID=2058894 RepID=UPI000CE50183|nr:hypothetical protein [Arthrobacter sp. GMC3]
MSILVSYAGASSAYPQTDNDDYRWGYQITGSGSLAIVRADVKGNAIIESEVSPSAWVTVEGSRFLGDLSKLEGAAGTLKMPPARFIQQ